MKKLFSILLAVVMVFGVVFALAACNNKEDKYRIALITDVGTIDDKSFNQGAWEGVVAFATANEMAATDYKYIKPYAKTDADYIDAIELAIDAGFNIIVTPGFLFEVAIYTVQNEYPDVHFILLDGAPHNVDYSDFETAGNVASVTYAEEQAGYLAGYAAVMEGYRKLGFMGGMNIPAVAGFGHGYIQGAEKAAVELNLSNDAITLQYHYTGGFVADPTVVTTANTIYDAGAEVIFSCGGAILESIKSSADVKDKKIIGVDVNQYAESDRIITSATKGLAASVEQVLESIVNKKDFGTKFGGKTTNFEASNGGIGLPTDATSFRFSTFTVAQYDTLFAKLVSKTIVPIRALAEGSSAAGTAAEFKAQFSLVKVVVVPVA